MIYSDSNGTFWNALKEGKKQKLLLYGTSLTISESEGASGEWVLELRKWGKEKFQDRLTVINSAEGGKSSKWGLEQLKERVLNHQPDYVLIEFGMNDSDKFQLRTLKEVQEQLSEIILQIKASNPTIGIGLMTMNPKIENAINPAHAGRHNLLPAYYDLYREAAIKYHLDFIDHYSSWIEREKKEPGFLVQHIPDGVHPDGESVKMITFENLKTFLTEKSK